MVAYKKVDPKIVAAIEEKRKAFLQELVEVYKRYDLALSHEDEHGGFLVTCYSEEMVAWLLEARVEQWSNNG